MSGETIGMLFDYHYGMFDRVWDCVEQLTAAQFVEEKGYSLGSVRNHLAHCMNVDDRWIARLRGQPLPEWRDEACFPDLASTRAEWRIIRERVLAGVAAFSEDDLDETIPLSLPHRFAESKWNTRREVLLHMVNHGTDHRAQILSRLHELGARTLEQDLILYLWDEA